MSDYLSTGWLTREQAQELTGYSEDHLTRLARAGTVKATKFLGHAWLFERDGLLLYKATVRSGPKGKSKQK